MIRKKEHYFQAGILFDLIMFRNNDVDITWMIKKWGF